MQINTKAANELLASVETQIAALEGELAELRPFRDTLRKWANGSTNGNSAPTPKMESPARGSAAKPYDLSKMNRGQAGMVAIFTMERGLTGREIGGFLSDNGVDMSGKHALITLNNALGRLAKQRVLKKRGSAKGNIWEIADMQRAQEIIAKPPLPTSGRRGGGMTYGDVCEAAIRNAGHALHISELFTALAAAGMHPKRNTLARGLMTDSKKRFRNLGGNTYELTERPAKATS